MNTHARVARIAVVVPNYGLVGGLWRFAAEVTERLARTGRYEMHVFANRWQATAGSPVIFHKVPIIWFPRWLRPLSFPWFAQRAVDRGRFDLVHSHSRLFRADVFSMHCVPHAGWVHSVREKRTSLFDRAMTAVEQRMLRNNGAACFMPVSSLVVEAFRQEYRELPGEWRVVHPGVDAVQFARADRAECRREIGARHGIGPADLLVLFVGMNFELKGLDTILAALVQARTKADVRLLVVGRGDERKYGALAESLGVADAVTFAGTQPTGIERYYRAADALMILSAFDTFGMVVLEAMAAGVPVIVSGKVGAKDLVVDGENGFVVTDPQDANTAATRLVQLVDAKRRNEMGAKAQQQAAAHGWDAVVQDLDRVYQDRLARPGGRAE